MKLNIKIMQSHLSRLSKMLVCRRNIKLYSSLCPYASTMSWNDRMTVCAAQVISCSARSSFGFSNPYLSANLNTYFLSVLVWQHHKHCVGENGQKYFQNNLSKFKCTVAIFGKQYHKTNAKLLIQQMSYSPKLLLLFLRK